MYGCQLKMAKSLTPQPPCGPLASPPSPTSTSRRARRDTSLPPSPRPPSPRTSRELHPTPPPSRAPPSDEPAPATPCCACPSTPARRYPPSPSPQPRYPASPATHASCARRTVQPDRSSRRGPLRCPPSRHPRITFYFFDPKPGSFPAGSSGPRPGHGRTAPATWTSG